LKIKCVEALSAGCPLVTNAAGADGLEDGAGRAYRLADNWNDFADHVVTLLTDEQARVVLETGARTFADRLFSPGAVFAELRVVLGRVRKGTAGC
jgi:glycosyltransferase involved in cell wall biosynthesis